MPTQDDLALLLLEAGLIWGEDEHGVLGDDTVFAVARTGDGRLAVRPGGCELADGVPPSTSGCRSFLVPDQLPEPSVPDPLRLHSADQSGWLGDHQPADWPRHEWQELLAGRRGPCAAVTDSAGIVALCHSARLSPLGAEAGVRTEPDRRGQGLAAVVVARWAAQLRNRRIPLFYSASDGNAASLRVADKMGLTPIGRLWRIFLDTPR